ncbi:dTDP-4-amino-4,6-dideoxygalactose transaminase [Dactylosporangium sucinum]|uniref:dTDP-4-amino-4,6-dideoxy-D-glucose transaminase n=1 Tax=Dactylosporangium sucinum TaxID=1424081 RepID=A0A917UD84_9ACTN|nr:dTDP-4-amino-4,6-dideoxygalactose transaminase [Dactylosporangium sucinum]GGM84537.1 dTDP-4-amino-4,6-dideoxy-D-glucose transaminase [Dactylosporangium sucinum]
MTSTNQLAVPFNKGFLTGDETGYMHQAMTGGPMTGDGPFTKRASALLTELVGAPHALLTTSCTHALDMTAMLLDLGPGDEVILPSFTFCSTANAYVLRGAVPVFVDIRPDTLNLDERQVEAAVTDRTKAIVVVHYAGVGVEMDAINAIAERHGLVVIEDNAHGLGGTYRGRNLGSIGAMATQSFHETKNVQCGEGGALVFNDPRYFERAEIIREKGTNRGQFFRGMVDKYRWIDIGSSYLPSDLLAAFLTAQLEHFADIQRRRHHVWSSYDARLAAWAAEHGVVRPTVPADREQPAHLYYLLLPDLDSRQSMLKHLLGHGVLGTFHYQPLHLAPAGEKFGRVGPEGCPVTEDVADRLLRLPLYAGMTDDDIDLVINAVETFRPRE